MIFRNLENNDYQFNIVLTYILYSKGVELRKNDSKGVTNPLLSHSSILFIYELFLMLRSMQLTGQAYH